MGKFYKQPSPKLSNCIILNYHIISLEGIQQTEEKCYCTCETHQRDGQIIYQGWRTVLFHHSIDQNFGDFLKDSSIGRSADLNIFAPNAEKKYLAPILLSTNVCIIFGNSTTFQCRFHSPQVKRDLISSTKSFVY